LQMDVIDHKIDRTNVGTIMCAFRDSVLGAKFKQLFISPEYAWRISPRLYFSATSIIDAAEKKKATAKEKITTEKAKKAEKATNKLPSPPPLPNQTRRRENNKRPQTLRSGLGEQLNRMT
jgi:hypothetical protein